MIREFSAHTKATNKKAIFLFSLCTALAFCLIFLSLVIPLYRGVVSLLGMGFMVAAITLYTRYVSPEYFYDVTFDSEGTALFVVRQMIGKRQTTLCRIALYEIVKIEREDATARKIHKTPYGFVKYNYSPTLMPEFSYRITSVSRYEKSEIVIEASEEFSALLKSYSEIARKIQAEIEENEEY